MKKQTRHYLLLFALLLIGFLSIGLPVHAMNAQAPQPVALADDLSGYPVIKADTDTIVTISAGGDIAYFQFTPGYTETYTFYSECSDDTFVYLYDSEMTLLQGNDNGGEDGNFSITYELNAHQTYVLAARFYDSNKTGTFMVHLQAHHESQSEVITPATCTEPGLMGGNCLICGQYYTEEISASGHSYVGEETIAPTCTENGEMTYTCTVCGHFYKEPVPGVHVLAENGVECAQCGESCIDHGTCGTSAQWVLYNDGTLVIFGTGKIDNYNYSQYKESITRVVVQEGITSIQYSTFSHCTNLKTVILPNGITSIEEWTFENCSSLTTILLPDGITYIGYYAFWKCSSLEAIDLPDELISIDFGAFYGCSSLKEIVIPDGVKEISGLIEYSAEGAFTKCSSLTSVTLPEGLTTLGDGTFQDCTSLTSIDLPDTLTSLGLSCFRGCTSLKEITLPPNLTEIPGEYMDGERRGAFTNCTSLTTINFPSGLTTIGDSAFYGCSSLSNVTIPDSVTEIGHSVFRFCNSLKEVKLPNGLKEINCSVFSDCTSLEEIVIPDSVQKIYGGSGDGIWGAFYGCTNLKSIKLPSELTHLGGYTFADCSSLKTIELPSKLSHVERNAFSNCSSLNTITFTGDAPRFYNDVFENVTATVYYPINNETWTGSVMKNYGGTITWIAACTAHTFGEPVYTWSDDFAECTAARTCTYSECTKKETETVNSTVTTQDATCVEDGSVIYTAVFTSASFETQTKTIAITMLGHNEVIDKGYAATCTENGLTDGVHCDRCGEILKQQEEIPAAGHRVENGVCSKCGKDGFTIEISAPSILSCYSKQQTSVKVTWSLVDGADGYELWRTATPDQEDSWIPVKTIASGTQDRYTNQGLEKGVTYYYKVRAYLKDEEGNRVFSNFSNVDYMPAAVVWDAPYSNATFRIRLRWNEISGAHGYQIWRLNEDGETWSVVKTLGDKNNTLTDNQGATTAYSNTGLKAGEKYTYKIRAFSIPEDGKKVFGAYSDEFTIAVMPEAPVITVTSPKAGRAQLSWDAVNGASGYQIWMLKGGTWSIVKSITDGSTTYTKYDLNRGSKYQFKVRAYTEVDGKKTFGAYSEIAAVKIK